MFWRGQGTGEDLPYLAEYLYCLEHEGAHPPITDMPHDMKAYWVLYWMSKKKAEKLGSRG